MAHLNHRPEGQATPVGDAPPFDATDRALVAALQEGLPIVADPFGPLAQRLGLSRAALLDRLAFLRDLGAILRFGPVVDATALGGGYLLCAMAVPPGRVEAVAGQISAMSQVAQAHLREHTYNLWFVLAAEDRAEIEAALAAIEAATGLEVLRFDDSRDFSGARRGRP